MINVSVHRKLLLVLSALSLIIVPVGVALLVYGRLPAGFGLFPPQQSGVVPGFWLPAFLAGLGIALGISVAVIAPGRLGFTQSRDSRPAPPITRFPAWFWPGLAVWLLSWIIMWELVPGVSWLAHYSFVPLWWGYILTLDGLVFRRTGGASLLARRPLMMLAIALSSCVGWYLFEYLDYFIYSNWYYPNNAIFSRSSYIIWYGLAYTTVFPSVFETYTLLTSFDFWRTRYANGPRLALSQRGWWMVLGLGLGLLAALVIRPFLFFPMVWVSPLLVLSAALMLTGYWTPLTPLAQGNWSMVVLIGVACTINYFLGELWNFWSTAANPNFWKYDVPYVNVVKIFEMPLLGFFGYVPFGLICWIWWVHNAALLGINPNIEVVGLLAPEDSRSHPAPAPYQEPALNA